MELRALRDRIDVAEAEKATLRATIRTMGAVETSLRDRMRDERQTHIEIERQQRAGSMPVLLSRADGGSKINIVRLTERDGVVVDRIENLGS
nr:hypothetical protein [Tanacetum cinerariifolium]